MSKLREEDIERWITVNGNHIPIKNGESEEDAIKRFTDYVDNASGKKKKEAVDEDVIKQINPSYKAGERTWDKDGWNNNCAMCAVAFEMAMRGEDVQANPYQFGYPEFRNKSKNIEKAFGCTYKDGLQITERKKEMFVHRIHQEFDDWQDGDRGIIKMSGDKTNPTSRHVINVVKQNGHTILVDSQDGTQEDITSAKNIKMFKGFANTVDVYKVSDKNVDKEYAEWAYKKREKK